MSIEKVRAAINRANTAASEARVSHRGPTARLNRIKKALGRIEARHPSAYGKGFITERVHKARAKAAKISGRVMGSRPISGRLGKRASLSSALSRIEAEFGGNSPGTRYVPDRLKARVARVKAAVERVRTRKMASTAKKQGARIVSRLRKHGGWYPRKTRKPYRPDLSAGDGTTDGSFRARMEAALGRIAGEFANRHESARKGPPILRTVKRESQMRGILRSARDMHRVATRGSKQKRVRGRRVRRLTDIVNRMKKYGNAVISYRPGGTHPFSKTP